MKLGKYMTARALGTTPHESYTIMESRGGNLGVVDWYERWKQYVLDPDDGAVFSHDCLNEIAAFCRRLSQEAVQRARPRCDCHGKPPVPGCGCWCHKHGCATMRADGEP